MMSNAWAYRTTIPVRVSRIVYGILALINVAGAPHAYAASTQSLTSYQPKLTDSRPCPDQPGFTCSSLLVPLDHSGQLPGALTLAVAVADNTAAPKGILLMLSGGPGQPGVSLVKRVKAYLEPEVLDSYQMVMFDQRGTGTGAIDCPALQEAVGGSDFRTPPADAVAACALQLGQTRDFYGTPDTVRDIDLLRRALGTEQFTLNGISYGTFTAEHYALRYPEHVRALVLDSVVPHQGFNPLIVEGMAATARVLREACAVDAACTTDPAVDLAWLVRHGQVGGEPLDTTRLLDALAIVSLNSVDPTFSGVPELLHAARNGDTAELEGFLAAFDGFTPPNALSAGLHLTTLCADLRFPWGDAASALAGREKALERTLARLEPAQLWPYDRTTARAVLPASGCLRWPPAKPSSFSGAQRLEPPTLILHGDRDLFCPVAWAYREAKTLARGQLVVVPGNGHGVQGSPDDPTGRDVAAKFLLGR